MDNEKLLPHQILTETIGISIKILTNDFKELPGYEGSVNSYQEIVFQVNEEEGKSQVINPEGGPEDLIQEAIDSCPMEAINWEE